jgi:hypothetical protein
MIRGQHWKWVKRYGSNPTIPFEAAPGITSSFSGRITGIILFGCKPKQIHARNKGVHDYFVFSSHISFRITVCNCLPEPAPQSYVPAAGLLD